MRTDIVRPGWVGTAWRGVAVIVVTASTGAWVVPVPVASAAVVGDGTCDDGELCLWSERDFKGCFADFQGVLSEPDYKVIHWNNCTNRNLNDDVSSYQNQTDSYAFFQTSTKYGGNRWCAYPGASENALNQTFGPGSADNQFSSHRPGPDETGNTSEPDGRVCNWRDYR